MSYNDPLGWGGDPSENQNKPDDEFDWHQLKPIAERSKKDLKKAKRRVWWRHNRTWLVPLLCFIASFTGSWLVVHSLIK